MADLSPAEIMLDSLVPAQRLIKRLQAVLAALRDSSQAYIDELTAQREEVVSLVKLIPDQTAQTVIELRYGLVGSGCELMPYPEVGETLNYADKTILQYRKRGVDQLNQILENGS